MNNGLLCVGGVCDDTYQSIDERRERFHGCVVHVSSSRGDGMYKVWQWIDSDRGESRFYLIPKDWDGFELLDHMEKRAYPEDRL